jgi:hypothetical protein
MTRAKEWLSTKRKKNSAKRSSLHPKRRKIRKLPDLATDDPDRGA